MMNGIPTALRRLCLLLSGALFIPGPEASVNAVDAVDLSAWSRSADFRLNTTSTGAAIAGEIADFPVLIRLDAASFPFAEAREDGGDIRFTDPGGRELSLEIERWDAAAKRAELWVRVPLIKPGTDSEFIRMHWGNAAAVPVSDGKAVFDTGHGHAGVWHLGGEGVRNAVATTGDGEEIRIGRIEALIAEGRSFEGGNQGMLIPAGKALYPGAAITVSAWIHADSWQGSSHRILQTGIPETGYALIQDNDSLAWVLGGPAGSASIKAPLPGPGAWHHVAGTYDGAVSRLYVDGKLAASGSATGGILASSEALCLGCRAVQGKPRNSFEGGLDEMTLSRVARSEDWIKLAFANQRGQQVLVLPPTLVACQSRFDAPSDTTVAEGSVLVMAGAADCATSFYWSGIQGPVPRLLDPEVKALTLVAPRIPRDTVLIVRFTARFEEGEKYHDVRVTVREAIPDPVFNLPAMAAWNGKDTLTVTPAIGNLAAVKASRDSIIHFAWTLSGITVDTLWGKESLMLRDPADGGELGIRLCMENGGTVSCDSTVVTVALPVGLRRALRLPMGSRIGTELFDAQGRHLPASRNGAMPDKRGWLRFRR